MDSVSFTFTVNSITVTIYTLSSRFKFKDQPNQRIVDVLISLREVKALNPEFLSKHINGKCSSSNNNILCQIPYYFTAAAYRYYLTLSETKDVNHGCKEEMETTTRTSH